MKKIFSCIMLFLFLSPLISYADISCTPSPVGFVIGGKHREMSKLVLVCTGTTGTYTLSSTANQFLLGKKLYSIRAFPTTAGSVTDAADIEFRNSRGNDIFKKGTNLIPTTGEVEYNAYNSNSGLYWYPPLDDAGGYSLVVTNLGGSSAFTVELSVQEGNIQ